MRKFTDVIGAFMVIIGWFGFAVWLVTVVKGEWYEPLMFGAAIVGGFIVNALVGDQTCPCCREKKV